MIRVRKPDHAPSQLREHGVALTAELCNQVDAGERPQFDRGVYGADDVKNALRNAQHDKCCFCEAKLGHAQFGDIEHFRPKAKTQQHAEGEPTTGYYWLAYEWRNLYLSCEVCNRRHKRGLFPLANPERRVSSHHRAGDLHEEQPLFVDPGRDDPTRFIEFRREYAAPVDHSPRGIITIDALQLNRPALVEHRRERRQLLFACVTLLAAAIRRRPSADDEDLLPILDRVVNAAADGGEYSSMTRSLLRHVAPWRASWDQPVAALLDELRIDAASGLMLHLDGI
jgi:uncharacterized protein (TIGR02646 family)